MPNLNYGGTQDDTVNDIVKNEIMSLMKNNPRITITDIAKALNISRPTATRKIKEVKIDNYIYRIGSDKKGSWIVNERWFLSILRIYMFLFLERSDSIDKNLLFSLWSWNGKNYLWIPRNDYSTSIGYRWS